MEHPVDKEIDKALVELLYKGFYVDFNQIACALVHKSDLPFRPVVGQLPAAEVN